MGPHSNHLDDARPVEDLIDEPVLNRDPPRKGARQIPHEFLEPRRSLVRVPPEKLQELFRLRTKAGAIQSASVLLSLLREDDPPGRIGRYQPGFSEHFEIGVRIPRRIDSLMPGMDRR